MDEKNEREIGNAKDRNLAAWLDAAGWALFFIWTGVAFLADLGWGVGLIGVGVIIFGSSAAERYLVGTTRSRGTMCGICPMYRDK